MFVNNEDRIVKALETIAESQMKMVKMVEFSKKAFELTERMNNMAIMEDYDYKIPIKINET